jgi:hypothetical protein
LGVLKLRQEDVQGFNDTVTTRTIDGTRPDRPDEWRRGNEDGFARKSWGRAGILVTVDGKQAITARGTFQSVIGQRYNAMVGPASTKDAV